MYRVSPNSDGIRNLFILSETTSPQQQCYFQLKANEHHTQSFQKHQTGFSKLMSLMVDHCPEEMGSKCSYPVTLDVCQCPLPRFFHLSE
jgi:hypothetical protein